MRDFNNNEQPIINREKLVIALVIAILALVGIRSFSFDPARQFCIDSAVSYPDRRVRFYIDKKEEGEGCIYFHKAYGSPEEILNTAY